MTGLGLTCSAVNVYLPSWRGFLWNILWHWVETMIQVRHSHMTSVIYVKLMYSYKRWHTRVRGSMFRWGKKLSTETVREPRRSVVHSRCWLLIGVLLFVDHGEDFHLTQCCVCGCSCADWQQADCEPQRALSVCRWLSSNSCTSLKVLCDTRVTKPSVGFLWRHLKKKLIHTGSQIKRKIHCLFK